MMDILESGVSELFIKPDIWGFRDWVHKKKSQAITEKLMTEQEAISKFVSDGDSIATELYGTVRAPMSLTREIIRQGKKHLKVAGQGITEIDFLLAADLVDTLDITYVAWEVYGISNVLRRAVESGRVKTADWSNGEWLGDSKPRRWAFHSFRLPRCWVPILLNTVRQK
jgi:acyl CoA:acetate/3-ketoacid CoA transferase alpha subunit